MSIYVTHINICIKETFIEGLLFGKHCFNSWKFVKSQKLILESSF